jgi:PhzF family phenazine biosynthesis protein
LKAGLVEAHFDHKTLRAEAEVPSNFHVHSQYVSKESILAGQPGLARVLSSSVGTKIEYPIASIVNGMNFILVELSSLEELATVGLATSALSRFTSLMDEGWNSDFIGTYFFVILSNSEEGITTIRTRMVDSDLGEDPATGSAACDLACYLATKAGKEGVYNYQFEQGVEMGRSSMIRIKVQLNDEAKVKQVVLSGNAVKVQEGRILV